MSHARTGSPFFDFTYAFLNQTSTFINTKTEDFTQAQLALVTLATYTMLKRSIKSALYSNYRHARRFGVTQTIIDNGNDFKETLQQFPHTAREKLQNVFFNSAVKIPIVGPFVKAYENEQIEKELKEVIKTTTGRRLRNRFTGLRLPFDGKARIAILKEVDSQLSTTQKGKPPEKIDAMPNQEMKGLLRGITNRFTDADPTQAELVSKDCEAQVIAWMFSYFKGEYPILPQQTFLSAEKKDFFSSMASLCNRLNIRANQPTLLPPGFLTNDGAESNDIAICMAVAAARDAGIQQPEIIVPASIHPCFKQFAAKYGAKLIEVPVNQATGKADVDRMRRKINDNTCLIAGSAPSLPHGVFDPIAALADLAKEQNIPLHMDASIGFSQIFAREAWSDLPYYDFETAGITSIACNIELASVVLFNHQASNAPKVKTHGHFDWMGSTIPNGLAAKTKASMELIGDERYFNIMKALLLMTLSLQNVLKKIRQCRIVYPVESTIVSIDTPGVNSHLVAAKLIEAGWEVKPHLPTGFHFCVTREHIKMHLDGKDFMNLFKEALNRAISYAQQHPTERPANLLPFCDTVSSAGYSAVNATIPALTLRRR